MHARPHRSSPLATVAAVACALVWHCEAALVEVAFDPAGGALADDFRVVQVGGKYGYNANLYPSGSPDSFSDLPSGKITLAEGVFSYSTSERWCNYWTKPIAHILAGRPYTYVLDVLAFNLESGSAPVFHIGWTDGDTWQSAQLDSAPNISVAGTGRRTRAMTGRSAEIYRVLERAYIESFGVCSMTFRVQLFAGKDAVPADGGHAASGECVAMPLPVPVRRGFAFVGWRNAAGELVTAETEVAKTENHTLTAQWQPWTISIENGDRPQSGKPLTASTDYGDGSREGEDGIVSYKWFRGDWRGVYEPTAISDDASYTPVAGDVEHFLKAVVYVDGEEALSSALWLSKLPVVYIDTSDGEDIVVKTDEKTSDVRVQGNAKFKQQYDGLAFVKGRGNSTWGMPKKPYKVKLDKKTDLFGFGKNKHWVLLSNYIDVSSMRNKTAYDMSGAFGLEHMDSTWVEVVFNGRFDGMYQLCEHVRVDKTRVNVFNWEDAVDDEKDLSSVDPAATDITGGYLWELSNEYDEVSKFKIDVTGNGETDEDIPVMFNRPEFACTNPAMMDWCSNFWQDVYASWTSPLNQTADGAKDWRDLCDIDSMVSFWLVNEIFGNDDAWYKSRYCYKDVGGKLTFGPVWDCDWGLGSVAVGTNDVTRWRLARNNNSGWPVSFYKEWLDDPWFCLKALEKYREMRPKFAALLADGGAYDADTAYLAEAGIAEDARWNAERGQSYGENKRTQSGDAAIFKWWMQARLAWLDTQFSDLDSFVENVRNGESALPFSRTPGTLSANGSSSREITVRRRDEAAFAVAVPGAVTVDAMLNGRVAARSLPVSDGRCDFCARPFAADSGDGERALVAVIAYRADGSVAARDYVTLRAEVPPGFGVLLR